MQGEGYSGSITLTQYERLQFIREQFQKEGFYHAYRKLTTRTIPEQRAIKGALWMWAGIQVLWSSEPPPLECGVGGVLSIFWLIFGTSRVNTPAR